MFTTSSSTVCNFCELSGGGTVSSGFLLRFKILLTLTDLFFPLDISRQIFPFLFGLFWSGLGHGALQAILP